MLNWGMDSITNLGHEPLCALVGVHWPGSNNVIQVVDYMGDSVVMPKDPDQSLSQLVEECR